MTELEVIKKIIDRFDENIDDIAFSVEMLSKILDNLKKVIKNMEEENDY